MAPRADDSLPTRHSLLLRLQQTGDETGWREFFDAYWEILYRLARKAGLTETEAQEAVQETVIGVARKIGTFDADPRRGSFKSWLLSQARWRIADQFRARRKSGSPAAQGTEFGAGSGAGFPEDATGTDPLHRVPDPTVDPLATAWDEEWEQHVLRTALDRVIAQVSVKQFQMFDLHARQGLSVSETARATGSSVAAVYMAKSRVARLLKREVARVSRHAS